MFPGWRTAVALGAVFLACGSLAQSARRPDWSDLIAPRGRLDPLGPKLIERVQRDAWIREIVQLNYRAGDKILLYVHRPVRVAQPPVAIMLYGFPAPAAERFLNDQFANWVTQRGMAFIGFESALTGERYFARPMREWFISELDESLGMTTHDIQMIVDYIRTRDDFNRDRIGVFGQGSGGTAALLAAAVDPRIRAVDALNPWGDWANWFRGTSEVRQEERSRFTSPAFLRRIQAHDPLPRLKGMKTPAMRVQFIGGQRGTVDSVTSAFLKALPPQGVGRSFQDAVRSQREMMDGRLFTWLAESLRR